ncbi:hypothetical protein FNV1997 [Fusobacterium vincentii ATCC 49256]|uniref:Uncharacterized protein n=1 Tax=Fusobacterium vincentii ATCC 49256 TaxID=209882 RepID=Q7P824_FUSVC|nr:hypothetical protein FNV1997 [Fusobacterium vincentii ATCC 49256]
MKEKNRKSDLENTNEIIERVFNSENPEILLEKELNNPFENLKEQSKKLIDIRQKVEDTLIEANLAKENVVIAGTKEEKSFLERINPLSKSSTEISLDKIQGATYDLSRVVVNITENQTIFWDYLKLLSEITKFLFNLGIANTASNNIVVRYLEKKLANASKEELDDLAREEIENVVERLKKQQEIESKYENLKIEMRKEVSSNREIINDLSNEISSISNLLESLKKDNENKNLEIKKIKEEIEFLKEDEEEVDDTRSMKFLYISLGISIITLIIVIITFFLKLK